MTLANPPAFGVLRLSFASADEYRAYERENREMLAHIWLWHESLGNRAERVEFAGICSGCISQTAFSALPAPAPAGDRFSYRADWWQQLACACGLSNLERAVFHILREGRVGRLYHVGHFSLFRRFLAERCRGMVSSQYEQGRAPGEVAGEVRFEDITRLSFAKASFDSVICMEILEHLPDFAPALRELARVTVPGGRAFFSFPWLGGHTYAHLTRAELRPDGTILHHLPPEYHGDPATHEGILSYRSFGWKILDDLRAAGFTQARAEFIFGPVHGFMMLLNPVIVATK